MCICHSSPWFSWSLPCKIGCPWIPGRWRCYYLMLISSLLLPSLKDTLDRWSSKIQTRRPSFRPLSPNHCNCVWKQTIKTYFCRNVLFGAGPLPHFSSEKLVTLFTSWVCLLCTCFLHFFAFYCKSTLLLEREVENQMLAKLVCALVHWNISW